MAMKLSSPGQSAGPSGTKQGAANADSSERAPEEDYTYVCSVEAIVDGESLAEGIPVCLFG